MDTANAPGQKEFPEWMVTQALAAYLDERGKEYHQRMNWLFNLQAETPDGHRSLCDLCGFACADGKASGGGEESFKDNNDDRGKMPSVDFRKTYLGITPDFRYWTRDQHQQLLIEAKGTPKPIGQRDGNQGRTEFPNSISTK